MAKNINKQTNYTIYGIRIIGEEKFFYIGLTKNKVSLRISNHISSAKKIYLNNKRKNSVIINCGYLVESVILDEVVCSKNEALNIEYEYICKYIKMGHQITNAVIRRPKIGPNVIEKDLVKIVKMLSRGKAAKEIGAEMKLSPRTVEKKLEMMRLQYRVENTPHLVAHFLRAGFIK